MDGIITEFPDRLKKKSNLKKLNIILEDNRTTHGAIFKTVVNIFTTT